jgi:formate hydrogenlyase subunit 3/multisubunit Na+/H+ antiporter MnhD subunit
MMKTLARVGAGLSFASFFLAGALILAGTAFRVSGEYVLLTALGLFLVGTAFFTGAMLWLAAEKVTEKPPERALDARDRKWPWKIMITGVTALVVAIVAIRLVSASIHGQSNNQAVPTMIP